MEFAIAKTASDPREGHQRAVFVVEDSDSIRARIVDMLGSVSGLRVVGEATTAVDAVEGIEHSRPDAVVLDIQLAGSSGLEVLRSIHPRAPEIVFIVLTNYPNPQYRRICMQSGASHFLDKTTEFTKVAGILSRRTHIVQPTPPFEIAYTSH